MNDSDQLDRERQKRAREYARLRRRLSAAVLVLNGTYLGAWALFGWGDPVLAAIESLLGGEIPWTVDLLLIAGAIGLPWSILTFPISYYRGFLLPHRFELSTQSRGEWLIDQLKAGGVSLALGLPLLLGLFLLIRVDPSGWWLWAAGGYTLVSTVLASLAPVLLLPIFFHPEPLGEEHEDLRQRLIQLGREVGPHIEGIYKIDLSRRTVAANAALTGLGRTRRILLGDTLLENFEAEEIESVLAHELAHHVHGDIPLSLMVQSVLNFGAFFVVARGLRALTVPLELTGPADPTGLPALALLLGGFALLTLPLGNAFSRWRERLADDFTLRQTGDPDAFSRAMTRLANQNLAEADPERWVVILLHSHPPLGERIQRARSFAAEGDN